jgi:hypothetical protein
LIKNLAASVHRRLLNEARESNRAFNEVLQYDIWLLSSRFGFDGRSLALAIERTFAQRGGVVPADPLAFSPAFGGDPTKTTQWNAFVRKSRLAGDAPSLSEAVAGIARFLGPIVQALSHGRSPEGTWPAGGPWQ